MGQFYYAAKAFDVLERLDPNPEYWEVRERDIEQEVYDCVL